MANDVKLKLAVEGGQVVSQTIDGVTKRLEAMGGTAGIAKNMLAGMATGLSVAAFTAYTRAAIDAADAMNDLSQRVGISVRELAKYELAAAQSGTTMEALAKGVKGIAVNLADYGDALKKAGITATTADGAMRQIADVFAAMPDGMEKTTLAVKLFGKSGMDMIPMLNLGSAGLQDAAEKSAAYAEQMALLAPLADAFNDNLATLAMGGKTLGLTLVNEVMPSLAQISAALAESDGTAAGFAKTLGSTLNITLQTAAVLASDVAFVLKGMGREIGGIIAQFNALGEGGGIFSAEGRAAWVAVGDAMKEDAERARLELDRWQQQLLAGPQANQNAYNKRQGFGEKEYTDPLAQYKAILAALKEQNSAASDAEKIAKARAAAEKKAIEEATKTAQGIANIRNKEADDIDAYMRAESARLADTARASEDAVRAAQDEYDNHGKLQSAIAETTLARLQDQLVNKTAGTEAYASIARQVEAQRQLINILKNGEARDAAEDAAKALADANRKAAEESSKYWEDALMRAFESGKGFFDSLWSTIKNTLKTQVLKVLVTGSLTGLGLTGAAGATTSTLSGVSALGSLANLPTAISGLATAVTSLPSLLMSSSMGALDIAGFAMAGPAGWALAAAAAVAAIFGNRKTPSAGTGEGAINFDAAGAAVGQSSRYSGAWGLTAEVEKSIQGVSSAYMAAAASLGIGTVATQFAFGGNTGKEGKDPQFALGVNAGGVGYSSGEIKLTDENVQLAASRAILAALQGSEIPTYLEGVFDGLTASTATQDQITAVLENAKAYKDFHTALTALPWDNLTSMSYAAAKGLAEASGGLEALGNNLAGFYQNFYSDAEQTANLTRFLGDNFKTLGLTMPTDKLREWYRGQVEAALALDQSIPANAKYTAGLLSMQGGVNTLADSAESAAQRIIDAAAKLEAEIVSAQESAMQEYMSAQLEYNSLIASEQESAAQAMQAAAEAIESAMASAGQGIVAFIQSLLNTPTNAESNYRRDLALAQQGDVEASKRLPTSGRAYLDTQINSSATAYEAARATAKMVQELNALPAVKTYEQQLLEAVGGTTKAVQDLNGKLITELTVTARSEITKLINFVANTDDLPDDLKQLALGATSTFTKTVEYVLGSVLSPDMQALALEQNSTLTKTVRLALGDDLPDETKRIVLMASESVSKTIGLVAFSTMSADQQAMVLQTTGSITKTISLAAGELDQVALGVAFAQSGTIERIVRASGGVLTPEQQQLLSAVDVYNKTVNIDVKLDATELTAFQTMLQEIFGTISIPGISGDGLGGVDLTDIVGQAYLDRLESINTYINSLDWSLENSKASAWATYYAAQQYGVSQADIANATGLNYSDIQALFDSANVPRFAMGTNYLPSDMLAQVHQGERIIPAADNRELMSRLQDPQQNSVALVAEIKALRDDNAAQARAMVQLQQRLTKLMERWDSNGLPSERLET